MTGCLWPHVPGHDLGKHLIEEAQVNSKKDEASQSTEDLSTETQRSADANQAAAEQTTGPDDQATQTSNPANPQTSGPASR